MKYRIEVRSSAKKQLSRLERPVYAELRDAISALALTPRPSGVVKTKGQFADEYRIAVGPIRVLYEINETTRVVSVHTVRKRGDIY